MNDDFAKWIKGIDPIALEIWKESLAQVRQLHGDIWNGVRFFLTINGIIVAAIAAVFRFNHSLLDSIVVGGLAGFGFTLMIIALWILYGHRNYYLDMLIRKTMIEKELGFYNHSLNGVNLSFPWAVPTEYVDNLIQDHKNGRNAKCGIIKQSTLGSEQHISFSSEFM